MAPRRFSSFLPSSLLSLSLSFALARHRTAFVAAARSNWLRPAAAAAAAAWPGSRGSPLAHFHSQSPPQSPPPPPVMCVRSVRRSSSILSSLSSLFRSVVGNGGGGAVFSFASFVRPGRETRGAADERRTIVTKARLAFLIAAAAAAISLAKIGVGKDVVYRSFIRRSVAWLLQIGGGSGRTDGRSGCGAALIPARRSSSILASIAIGRCAVLCCLDGFVGWAGGRLQVAVEEAWRGGTRHLERRRRRGGCL